MAGIRGGSCVRHNPPDSLPISPSDAIHCVVIATFNDLDAVATSASSDGTSADVEDVR